MDSLIGDDDEEELMHLNLYRELSKLHMKRLLGGIITTYSHIKDTKHFIHDIKA